MEDIKKILFGKGNETLSIGRNGTIKTSGINIFQNGKFIEIYPITSKGSIANCRIGIPADKWYGSALDAILSKKELQPLLLGIHPLVDELLEQKLKRKKS